MRTSILTILFAIICGTVSETENHSLQKSVALEGGTYRGLTLGQNESIVHRPAGEIRGCLNGRCARKCCPLGYAYKFNNRKCIHTNENFNPPVVEKKGRGFVLQKGFNITEKFEVIYEKIICDREHNERRLLVLPNFKDFKFATDGKLYVQVNPIAPNDYKSYEPDQYCIDTFVANTQETRYNALICFNLGTPKAKQPFDYVLTSSIRMVSCCFILLTAAVYLWVPELRRLHGIVLIPFLLCFFMRYMIESTRLLLFILWGHDSPDFCIILLFMTNFCLQTTHCWKNMMCYDIWSTFNRRLFHGRSGSPQKRFAYYAIYAFGAPGMLISVLAALEFSGIPIEHPLMPNLRNKRCFVNGFENKKLPYIYVPILIICVANATFLGLTVSEIWTLKKEMHMLQVRDKSVDAQIEKETERFLLYVKMFIATTINWILDVVVPSYPDAEFLSFFTYTYLASLGFIVFVIFVCNKKTWKLIKKRYRQLKGDPISSRQNSISSTTQAHSTSRDDL